MRNALLALLTILASGPALAQAVSGPTAISQAVTNIDTELVKGRCRFVEDDGEVGHYALKRCPGVDGAKVYTEATMQSVTLKFRWGNGKYRTGVASHSIGTKLEWRGTGTKAAFKPHAAIVTAVVKEFDENHDNEKRHDVLAIIRIEKNNACLMAVLDAPGNKDARTLARATADAQAPAFSCRTGKPSVVGAPSHWAQSVIGFEGEAP